MNQLIKIMKTITYVVIVSLVLTGCGAKSPTAVVEATFAEITKGDNGDMAEYFVETLATEDTTTQLSETQKQTQELFFSQFNGKVLTETIDGETATVAVEVQSLNMAEILLASMGAAFGAALSGTELTDEAVNQIMLEQFQAAQVQTHTGDVALTKVDGEWKIDSESADFVTLIFGEVDADLGE